MNLPKRKQDQTPNQYMRLCVAIKWPEPLDSERWWTKFTAVRRRKLTACYTLQEGKCFYCSAQCWLFTRPIEYNEKFKRGQLSSKRFKATLEHLTPQVLGGFDNMRNLRMACDFCNAMRGQIPDWKEFKRLRIEAGTNLREASKKLRLWLFNKPGRTNENFVNNKETRKIRTEEAAIKLAVLWLTFPTFRALFQPALDELKQRYDR